MVIKIKKARLFILRNTETGPQKVGVGEVVLFGQEGILDSGKITEPLYYEHPEKGDVPIVQDIRFIIQ